jgi:hypothetical protein
MNITINFQIDYLVHVNATKGNAPMTQTEFQLRQYVIRLKGLLVHYAPEEDLKKYSGLLNAIDATLEEMERKDWRKKLAE